MITHMNGMCKTHPGFFSKHGRTKDSQIGRRQMKSRTTIKKDLKFSSADCETMAHTVSCTLSARRARAARGAARTISTPRY